MQTIDVTITALGSGGDGIAHVDGNTLFVPGALPGETVRLNCSPNQAPELDAILVSSPARITPPCALFGSCGGCTLQMLRPDSLLDWKVSRVEQALTRAGFSKLPPANSSQTPQYSRRRIDLAVRRVPNGMLIGLHQRRGEPVDMTTCHVLDPTIFALLNPLREMLGTLGALTSDGDLQINRLDSGLDLLLMTDREITSSDRLKLATFGRAHGIPRISWRARGKIRHIETVAHQGPVYETFGTLKVSPPPGAFLQATHDGEEAIVNATLNGLPSLNKRDVILELYAGCGTLTGPLATKGRVLAYEGEPADVTILRNAQVGHRFEIIGRDLARQPLSAKELGTARVVVLDPPYSGASAQIQPIAASGVRDIIYVSCSPKSLEKDAAVLAQAGYQVLQWTVVDQFLWSSEVESVIVFTRDPKRLKKMAAA